MRNKTIVIIAFFLLAIFCLAFYLDNRDKDLNLNGLEIKSSQFSDIIDSVGEGKFMICDMNKENDCYLFKKQRLEEIKK